MIPLQDRITVTVAEAAELTGIGINQIHEWVNTDDTFPVFCIGTKRVIEVQLLREWLKKRCKQRVGMGNPRVARIISRRRHNQ